jgi:PAS domain S-box-containing protein
MQEGNVQLDLSRYQLEKLSEDSEFELYRGRAAETPAPILVRAPLARSADSSHVSRLEHEFSLAQDLDQVSAISPIALSRLEGRAALVMRDPGGQPLDRFLGIPMDLMKFLKIAVGLAAALREVHQLGLLHKDLKPSNIFVDDAGNVRLTGFGFATRTPREHQPPAPPDVIPGTFAYMAPEQTGRMNRSIDSRSDLYSLGVTLYEMLVGALPFMAMDPTEWIYCHMARIPPPPSVRVEGVPAVLEAIILKLLAKNAEDRYQTTAGVEHDLRRCLSEWRSSRRIENFPLAEFDVLDRLSIPETLYGRESEIDILVDSFKQVSHGRFDVVFVSGYSGVGKSAFVNELRRTLYSPHVLFASGKFDQYKQNIPYATLADAFQDIVRHILSGTETELVRWRAALLNAIGINAQLMIDLFPKLRLVLGEQIPVATVTTQEEKNRFQLVFRRFLGVFAQSAHPLVLFLDDLQWADTATLELLELLITKEEIPYLLLVGAFRSNEVEASQSLRRTLDAISAARGGLRELKLAALTFQDVGRLVADALHMDPGSVESLTDLVFQKTQGNPFFAGQFLSKLYAEGLLQFNRAKNRWRWDREGIRTQAISDNVAELMAGELVRYGGPSLTAIKQFACLGNSARTATLSSVMGVSKVQVDTALRQFVATGLVHRVERGYAFAHDRVREAAYALVPDEERASVHLRIGRLLSQVDGPNEIEDGIFEIVNQINRGIELVVSTGERWRLAELNLIAGKRAKAAAAYESALTYLATGRALLGAPDWNTHYRTMFDLEFHQADCKFMTGDVAFAEERLVELSERCVELPDRVLINSRQMMIYGYLGRMDHAIDLSLACLARMGEVLPVHPSDAAIELEYREFCKLLDNRPVAELANLPRMVDPHWLLVMDVFEALLSPAGTINTDLQHLIALRMVNLSLGHGQIDETVHAYVNLGAYVVGWRYGDFATGHAFAQLATRLVDEYGYDRYAARAFAVMSGTVGPWCIPLRDCYNLAIRATEIGQAQGGITYSGYAWACGLVVLLDAGKSLSDVQRHAESVLALARSVKFPLIVDFINVVLTMVRALRGLTISLETISDAHTSEREYESYLGSAPHLWHAWVRYRIRKLQLQFISGQFTACQDLLSHLEGDAARLKVFEYAEYQFYSALTRSACHAEASEVAKQVNLLLIKESSERLSEWARLCPTNFGDRATLVSAEIARLEGRVLDAERLYEEAIRLAGEHGAVHNEAIANEIASGFYSHRGFETIAQAYLRNARACYARWEADGKVRQIDRFHPQLSDAAPLRSTARAAAGTMFEYVDVPAVVEMYRAVSSEIVLDSLIERLMTVVLENAGASKGLLLLPRESALRLVAAAIASADAVIVNKDYDADLSTELPISVLNLVVRTQETVIIDDALMPNVHSADAYILRVRPRSVLCLPLVKQKRLVGVLYLENHLSSYTFTKERLSVLRLLASQAAVSLENAELFESIQKTQDHARRVGEELRRSFDMIPALAWRASPDGTFEFSNKQWHDYTGIPFENARSGTWIRAFHPDDEDKVAEKWQRLVEFRTSGEFEARMRRFDGEFRRFLVRVTPMSDEEGNIVMWHGTNTDIENLKRAEQAQEAFARISRVTALGELTVSIAHEVNQPLMAIVTNAATCMRWLADGHPNITEARLAAERIIRDGHRAGDVIASIRALAKKAMPQTVEINLNDAIAEVLVLARNELDRAGIIADTDLAVNAASVLGDRVQMQQVVLNLIMNGIEAITAANNQPRLLTIRTQREESGYVTVTVADTGVGLGGIDSKEIFEVFFTTKADGVGIGLSICRSIIEAHRGRLWASANLPHGTVFHFTVPLFSAEVMH